jgi:dihydroorotate dehydrogenase electron transfer subunit
VARVISNRPVAQDFCLLEAELPDSGDGAHSNTAIQGGQFCMLRAWDAEPVLSRPLSVFDAAEGRVSFLYKTVGRGTAIFSRLRSGDSITVQGPLGRGFPAAPGRVAMVGGGAGIAPLFLAAKQRRSAGCVVDLFLGFSGEAFLAGAYRAVADSVVVKTGGFVTDAVEPSLYDRVFCCGPEAMMRALWEKCRAVSVEDRLFVSLESRMACGVGACYGCSRKTAAGNKKVCRDGPVFAAPEVFEP